MVECTFLLEVDLDSALAVRLEGDLGEIKTALRDERIRYRSLELKGNQIIGQFRDADQIAKAMTIVRTNLESFSHRVLLAKILYQWFSISVRRQPTLRR